MTVLDSVRVILYRCHEKGLEILLINNDLSNDPDVWRIPKFDLDRDEQVMIELDDIKDENGLTIKAMAMEADWHDIPSIRGLLKSDVKRVKKKIKKSIPALEKGTYFTVKEAFKHVLPQEYKALKELKDIILDRNMATNI